MSLIELNDTNHDEHVKSDTTIIIDFSATWCGPCKAMKPAYKKACEFIHESKRNVLFGIVDVDESQDLAVKYHISCMPTLIMIVNGKQVAKNEGGMNYDNIINFINKHVPTETVLTETA